MRMRMRMLNCLWLGTSSTKKKTGKCGNFSKTRTPPPPPSLGMPCLWRKKLWVILEFRTLETFLFFTKMFTFWVVLWLVEVGMDDPPPTPCGKNSHFFPFSLICLQNDHSGTQNKINLKWSNWSDNTSPYCKTWFSTSEWIWHAKKTIGQITKEVGFG